MAKTVVEELAEANERIASFETDATTKDESIVALTTERDEAIEAAKVATVAQTTADEAKAKANKALKAEQDEHVKTKAGIEEQKTLLANVLANPAFAAAAKTGLKDGTADGGDADSKPTTKAEALESYRAIKAEDPVEEARAKAAFREENKVILGL